MRFPAPGKPRADGSTSGLNDVNIQAFIFNWRGHAERAAQLETALSPLVDVTVINSEDAAKPDHPRWVHLGETAYFCAQWNAALMRFKSDVLFHIQADASHDDFPGLLGRAHAFLSRPDVGLYEPNVDYTDIRYTRDELRPIATDVLEVPLPDCTCWFIHRAVLETFRPIDLKVNRYGWGVPGVMAAKCRLTQRICVRDYSVTIQHPRRRGYPNDAALQQRNAYFRSFDQEHRDALRTVYADFAAFKAPPGDTR
jgi:hypothetical protein